MTRVRLSERAMAARWGRGLNHQDVHVVNVIPEFPWDWLLGRGPQKSLEHILGKGTAGNEPMMALGREGGSAMGAQNAGTAVSRHNHVKGGVGTARLVGPCACSAMLDTLIALGAVQEGE